MCFKSISQNLHTIIYNKYGQMKVLYRLYKLSSDVLESGVLHQWEHATKTILCNSIMQKQYYAITLCKNICNT